MRFRIRSSRRDETRDASRLGSIERSIQNAIADAELEKTGLNRRIEDATNRASMLMGTESLEYIDRGQKKNQLLADSEDELVAAEKRVRQLAAHLEHLRHMLEFLKPK
jgi:hypothetical protein